VLASAFYMGCGSSLRLAAILVALSAAIATAVIAAAPATTAGTVAATFSSISIIIIACLLAPVSTGLLPIFKSGTNLASLAISRLVPHHKRPRAILHNLGHEHLINNFSLDAVGPVPLAIAWAFQAFAIVEEVAREAAQGLL
jgi:hypothetical protein